jgi:ubiquinone biosynthesis protein
MVSGLFSTARQLPRLREISMVFVRHGLGDLVRRAGIATLLEQAGHVLYWGEATEIAHLEAHQRARLAFEQLGPTFVKLGQMLSTREDLLPPAWTTELARLHSDVTPVPFEDLLPQVEQALGRSLPRHRCRPAAGHEPVMLRNGYSSVGSLVFSQAIIDTSDTGFIAQWPRP